MWYSNMYRRHLCDMHIDDWNESFLSEFSPEIYVENLKIAKIQNAMLYFQSHVGLCYYPTKSGIMHKSFIGREDEMRRLLDMCHKETTGIYEYYDSKTGKGVGAKQFGWSAVFIIELILNL